MAMVPYRTGFGVLPMSGSLFDAFDDMLDFPRAVSSKAFPVDVEDKGDAYEVKAYLTGVTKDNIDVELTEKNHIRKFAQYYPKPTDTSF